MSRALLLGLAAAAIAGAAHAQDPHAGHARPAPTPPDPHAGHIMPTAPAPADPHAGHVMPAPAAAVGQDAPVRVGDAPAPPPPTDHAADRIHGAAAMAAARARLRAEHGGYRYAKVMLERGEYRPAADGDTYAWEGQASFGGDLNRFVLTSTGEGQVDHGLERVEVQALYARAISPYFNLQAGLRQDLEPRPRRTYATLGLAGLAPYWFEVGAAAFLSDAGEVSARLEGSYDLRLTQRLILEPQAELNLVARDVPALGLGSGLSDLEVGLRLRYQIRPELAPYVGLVHTRRFGATADFARAAGEDVRDTRLALGLRAWF